MFKPDVYPISHQPPGPERMDCREFQRKHVLFVDELLSGVDQRAMAEHLRGCNRCAAQDTAVRRSLLVVRNHVRDIEPSADFHARLAIRLREEGRNSASSQRVQRPHRGVLLGAALAAAAGFALVGVPRFGAWRQSELSTQPLVRSQPPTVDSIPTDAAPAFVVSVSSGMAIVPALMLSEEWATPLVQASTVQAGIATPSEIRSGR